MTFREKIINLRKIRGLTQDEFAKAIGVSRQAVYKWECGQSYPEVPKLLEIKALFNVSIDDLLDDRFEVNLPEKKRRKKIKKETREKIEMNVREEFASIAERIVLESEEKEESASAASAEEMFNISVSEKDLVKENIPEVKEEKNETAEVVTDKSKEISSGNTETESESILPIEEEEEIRAYVPENEESAKEEPIQKTDSDEAKTEKKKGFFGRLFGRK